MGGTRNLCMKTNVKKVVQVKTLEENVTTLEMKTKGLKTKLIEAEVDLEITRRDLIDLILVSNCLSPRNKIFQFCLCFSFRNHKKNSYKMSMIINYCKKVLMTIKRESSTRIPNINMNKRKRSRSM